MEEDQSFINFNPNDFIINISPIMENGKWTGDIDVGQITTDENSLDKEDYSYLSVLTDMVMCAIPLMEIDSEYRKKLYALAIEQFGDDNKPRIKERKGNVVKVNFN